MSHDENDRPLDNIEAQLAALRPAASGIDRDALLYAAGRAVGEAVALRPAPQRWAWPLAAATSLLLAATFASLWVREYHAIEPTVVQAVSPPANETIAASVADDETSPPLAKPLGEASYFHLRQVALRDGVDALPQRLPRGRSPGTPPLRAFPSPLLLEEG